MQGIRGVISTLTNDGREVMGPGVLVWHYPENSIVNNSLLTVESNHFCVLKSTRRDPQRLRYRAIPGHHAGPADPRLVHPGLLWRSEPVAV